MLNTWFKKVIHRKKCGKQLLSTFKEDGDRSRRLIGLDADSWSVTCVVLLGVKKLLVIQSWQRCLEEFNYLMICQQSSWIVCSKWNIVAVYIETTKGPVRTTVVKHNWTHHATREILLRSLSDWVLRGCPSYFRRILIRQHSASRIAVSRSRPDDAVPQWGPMTTRTAPLTRGEPVPTLAASCNFYLSVQVEFTHAVIRIVVLLPLRTLLHTHSAHCDVRFFAPYNTLTYLLTYCMHSATGSTPIHAAVSTAAVGVSLNGFSFLPGTNTK